MASDDEPIDNEDDPVSEEDQDAAFMKVLPLDSFTMHADLTGKFPVKARNGDLYLAIFVYRGYIHVEGLPSRTATMQVKAAESMIRFLREHGQFPKAMRLDNETSRELEQHLKTQGLAVEYVPPTSHRRNKAERAIRTFKNHFIATLSSTAPDCPLNLWYLMRTQAELAVNLLRPYTVDPTISAYEGIHQTTFDFQAHPIAPCGTAVIIYDKPEDRDSWAPHGVPGYYMGPATMHYRAFNTVTRDTGRQRVTDSLAWFPAPYKMPGANAQELLLAAVQDLTVACRRLPTEASGCVNTNSDTSAIISTITGGLQSLAAQYTIPVPSPPWPSRTQPDDPPPGFAPKAPPANVSLASADDSKEAGIPRVVPPTPSEAAGIPRMLLTPGPTGPTGATTTTIPPATAPIARVLGQSPIATVLFPTVPATPSPMTNPGSGTPVAVAPTPPAAPAATPPTPVRSYPNTRGAAAGHLPHNRTYQEHEKVTGKPYSPAKPAVPDAAFRRVTRSSSNNIKSSVAHVSGKSSPKASETQVHKSTSEDSNGWTMPHKEVHDSDHPSHREAIHGPDQTHWQRAAHEEIIRLHDTSKTISFIRRQEVPMGRTVSYYNPQYVRKHFNKVTNTAEDVYRVRGTVGGNITDYEGERSAATCSMTTVKILLNAVISENAGWATADISDFYLGTDLDRPEYMRVHAKYLPQATRDQFEITLDNDYAYCKISKGLYGLPQAGMLAQRKLIKHLAAHGYHLTPRTECLFRHETRPITFALVVDDFGIKYDGKEHLEHLLNVLRMDYRITVNETGSQFIGLNIDINRQQRTLRISMKDYVAKNLKRFHTEKKSHDTNSATVYTPPVYGQKRQLVLEDDTAPLSADRTKFIQQVVGVFLYYARAVDPTMLHPINAIASQQAKPTQAVWDAVQRFLQYAATWQNAVVEYHASDMQLKVQSDASYLSVSHARSRAGGFHYLGNKGKETATVLNGGIHCISLILDVVVASAGEAEYGAIYINAVEAEVERQILDDLGYPQQATPMEADNKFAVNLANKAVTQRKSKAIDMRFHWIQDRVEQGHFTVTWKQGSLNIADYFTKCHPAYHVQDMRKFFVVMSCDDKSPKLINKRRQKLLLQGCADQPRKD
jgi:hypothetical protein